MERGRKRSVGRPKADPKSKSSSPSKPQARSKSRGRPPKKEAAKTRTRSKARPRRLSVDSDRSASPPKSRARSKSPGKARATSKSRRSSSRTRGSVRGKKSANDDAAIVASEKKLQPNLVLKDVKQLGIHENFSNDKTLNAIIRRSLSRDVSIDKEPMKRRSSRISNIVRDNAKEAKLGEAEKPRVAGKAPSLFSSLPKEFGGWPGALVFTILAPASALALHLACTKDQCTLSRFHVPRNWRVYLNLEAAEMVVAFILFQAILSLLPIGRRVGGPPGRNGTIVYRCNGLLSAVLTIGVIAGLWYLKYPVTIVYEKLIPLLVVCAILGPLLGLILYLKSAKAPVPGLNPFGVTGNKLYDYYVGREVNPQLFGRINVKPLLFRTMVIAILVLNGLLVLKSYEVRNEVSYTLLTSVGLYAFYIIDLLWFEESFAYTFEAMYEGTGGMLTQLYFLGPFFPTLLTKYIIQHRVELSVYALAANIFLFVIGFVIYRASNLQKAAFRKNPLNPALAHFETISTTRGKKLLVAGWWGWVRHPNYLGDILLHWAWCATAGFTNAIPYALPLMVTLFLIHRAKRDDQRCRQRYMSAWDEYCSRVRYRIIPRIY